MLYGLCLEGCYSVLLLSCSIATGAVGSPSLLLSCSITNNNTIAHNHHTHNGINVFLHLQYRYYCMADTRGSLATPPWNDGAYLTQKMKEHSWRVTSNEWDAYNAQQHSTQKGGRLSSAVLATTFRHPVDRWYVD